MTPELKWLTDPTVFAVNRLDAHSDHVCYRSEAEIRLGGSSLRRSGSSSRASTRSRIWLSDN